MLFGTFRFIIGFLPLTLIVYYAFGAFGRRRSAAIWLALASFVFYCWADPVRNLVVLSASTIVNFVIGRSLSRRPDARILALGIALDLGYLVFFKYADFAVSSADALLGLTVPLPSIRLPIGISFFTFTQISLSLWTCYRGRARELMPASSITALFVVLLPPSHRRSDRSGIGKLCPQFDPPEDLSGSTRRDNFGVWRNAVSPSA